MPLRDHFHSPWQQQNHWEGFHSAWANTIVRHLNLSVLPERYRAVPQVHLGAMVETVVAAMEDIGLEESGHSQSATATANWLAPLPAQTSVIQFPSDNVCEVRVLDARRSLRLVGVVELISPSNKDRLEHRLAFVNKCAAYLQAGVGVCIVDIVTSRHGNLHLDLLESLKSSQNTTAIGDLYAVSYRVREDRESILDTWPASLQIGLPLPSLPLWLGAEFSVPMDLELTYQETCQVLRIVE